MLRSIEMMNKKTKYIIRFVIVCQLLTGVFHSISLFVDPAPKNETEKQLLGLMNDYHMPDGMGFNPSFSSLFLALSACFSLLCFMGAWINIYLLKKKVAVDIVKGLIGIQVFIFAACFAMMALFTFLPPVICTGLIFAGCLASYFTATHKNVTA